MSDAELIITLLGLSLMYTSYAFWKIYNARKIREKELEIRGKELDVCIKLSECEKEVIKCLDNVKSQSQYENIN